MSSHLRVNHKNLISHKSIYVPIFPLFLFSYPPLPYSNYTGIPDVSQTYLTQFILRTLGCFSSCLKAFYSRFLLRWLPYFLYSVPLRDVFLTILYTFQCCCIFILCATPDWGHCLAARVKTEISILFCDEGPKLLLLL